MKKNYNYTRRKLYLPEYGRHIQEMIDSLLEIEDRRERNRQARAVIAVMGNLNPLLRDTADFTHKLWDHLFIMSDFQLDVDSPYPQPSRQELTASPRRMTYSQGRITYKHYGKYVERMIRGLADERNPRTVSRTVDNLARYMRTKSYEYNQEHPNNEVIVKDIKRMSGGAIQIDEVALNNLRSDYKQPFSARLQKGAQQHRQPHQQQRQQAEDDGEHRDQQQVLPLTQSVVDSAALAPDGSYRMELTGVAKTPSLYNVIYDGERIPLLLAGGDRLTLGSVGSVIRNYTVEGSSESELLRQFYQAFVTGAQQLENMGTEFARKLTDEERKSLIKEYTAEYYRIRREQLRFIIEHKASLAAVYALYQRLPGDTYLFNGDSDVVYYRTVAEALQESYPESPYLQSLQAEIARMDARISLTSQITEARHPDLELTDIYGKKIRLSSLAGKVVLLDFWSAELGSSNALNADLKELYRKYADAPVGFEVYQVAVDTSKPLWITAVQEQQLPWISVSDLRGRSSVALGLYNVQRLPANFLIDKEGTIVAKNIYGKSLEAKLDELTK